MGTYQARESLTQRTQWNLTGRLKMKIEDTQIWSVIAVVSIVLLLFWAGAMVYGYLADDRSPTPADERSVPAPRSY
jgi:hypothetical protein